MHRVDTSTAVAVMPAVEAAGTPGFFSKGNPTSGTPATALGQDWCNMIQEELVAILLAFGVTPDQTKTDYGQISTAMANNLAQINGNASKVFKVLAAVADDEAVNLAQMDAAVKRYIDTVTATQYDMSVDGGVPTLTEV